MVSYSKGGSKSRPEQRDVRGGCDPSLWRQRRGVYPAGITGKSGRGSNVMSHGLARQIGLLQSDGGQGPL